MLCPHCSGVGFFWRNVDTTRQTSYGQDLNHRAVIRGDTCQHCHGTGQATELTLTGFGKCALIGLLFGLIALAQFWPNL